jgi:hypothetical protein
LGVATGRLVVVILSGGMTLKVDEPVWRGCDTEVAVTVMLKLAETEAGAT